MVGVGAEQLDSSCDAIVVAQPEAKGMRLHSHIACHSMEVNNTNALLQKFLHVNRQIWVAWQVVIEADFLLLDSSQD